MPESQDFAEPAFYRDRALMLARAQEQLRQAAALTQSAGAALAELSERYDIDLHGAIHNATAAGKLCRDAVDDLEHAIARTPIV